MKKILILLMIFTVFSSVEAENDLESLADKMIQEINFSSFSSKDEAKNFIEQYDKNIRKEFKKLSIDEKYYIFSYIRKKTGNYEDEKLDYLIKKYKKEGKFLWDMNIGDVEKDYKKLQNSQNSELAIVSLDSGCTASIKSFPGLIYYADKPSSKTYLKAYYGSDVRNGEDDYICDIELWYNLPKSKIWATNYLGREMLSNSPTGFGGVLSTRSVSGNRMSVIIGGTRAIAYGQSRNTLYNTIVIWE